MADDFLSFSKETQEELKKTIDGLSNIASKRLNAWVRFALIEEANEFAEYVKETKLTGNPLKKRTGETYNSVKAWTRKATSKRASALLVRPGVGVKGSLNYLAKWVGTPLEFMRPAFTEFRRGDRILKAVSENVSRQLDKAVKEYGIEE